MAYLRDVHGIVCEKDAWVNAHQRAKTWARENGLLPAEVQKPKAGWRYNTGGEFDLYDP